MRIVNVLIHSAYNSGSRPYSFKWDGEQLLPGDTVVVDTVNGYQVADVISDKPESTASKATKWIVQKVDLQAHKNKLQRYEDLKKLQAQLQTKILTFQQTKIVDMLVCQDPEAAKLVQQIKELENIA